MPFRRRPYYTYKRVHSAIWVANKHHPFVVLLSLISFGFILAHLLEPKSDRIFIWNEWKREKASRATIHTDTSREKISQESTVLSLHLFNIIVVASIALVESEKQGRIFEYFKVLYYKKGVWICIKCKEINDDDDSYGKIFMCDACILCTLVDWMLTIQSNGNSISSNVLRIPNRWLWLLMFNGIEK